MRTLGRNDPCHCGSGKKYKKCHLEADQRHLAATGPSPPESDSDSPTASDSPRASLDVRKLPMLLRRLWNQGPTRESKEFGELLSKAEPLLEYMAHQAEIEAAGKALEAHWSEFEKLAADKDRHLALVQSVFAEECFAPLRFSASDVQQAFDQVGYLAMMSPDDRTVETLRAAILHAASKERRSVLSMRLLLRLPEFVAAGRFLEAWLVQSAAYDTAEYGDESNAFLFQMFSFGYDAWAAAKRAKDESLLRELGLDPDALRSMDLDELDSWVQSQMADPANAHALEEFFRRNPNLREQSVANLEAIERNSTRLLERGDSRFLHLSFEEVQPWLTCFNERLAAEEFPSSTPSEATVRKLFKEVALPLMREMAAAIFTSERIRQLIGDLRKYRSELFAAGDIAAASQVMGAIKYLEREESPGENSFLLALCWQSIGWASPPSPSPGATQPG